MSQAHVHMLMLTHIYIIEGQREFKKQKRSKTSIIFFFNHCDLETLGLQIFCQCMCKTHYKPPVIQQNCIEMILKTTTKRTFGIDATPVGNLTLPAY